MWLFGRGAPAHAHLNGPGDRCLRLALRTKGSRLWASFATREAALEFRGLLASAIEGAHRLAPQAPPEEAST